jgi:hypothetical protein
MPRAIEMQTKADRQNITARGELLRSTSHASCQRERMERNTQNTEIKSKRGK